MLHSTLIVIVLYNCSIEKSVTFNSLLDALHTYKPSQPIDVIIYDNGPVGESYHAPTQYSTLLTLTYLLDLSNPGVSKAYNVAAKRAIDMGKKRILILDQDTNMPQDSLCKYAQALDQWPNSTVYLPILFNSDTQQIISPCRYFFKRGSLLSSITPGTHSWKGRNALNSGLLIDLSAFWHVGGYNEQVRLYFSDFIFIDRLKKCYPSFTAVDTILLHQLSSTDYKNISFALRRFELYCKGSREASNINTIYYPMYSVTIFLRSLRMCQRLKSTKPIRIFMKYFL